MASAENIEINPEFQKALEIMEESGQSVFITGRAGTGKSTLLQYFETTLAKRSPFSHLPE